MKILIVDDDENNLLLTKLELRDELMTWLKKKAAFEMIKHDIHHERI